MGDIIHTFVELVLKKKTDTMKGHFLFHVYTVIPGTGKADVFYGLI